MTCTVSTVIFNRISYEQAMEPSPHYLSIRRHIDSDKVLRQNGYYQKPRRMTGLFCLKMLEGLPAKVVNYGFGAILHTNTASIDSPIHFIPDGRLL